MPLFLALLMHLIIASADGNPQWKKVWSVPATGNRVQIDNLGNCLVINQDQLVKYRDNGTVFRQYSNKTLGTVTSADPANPLKILLFYKDFSRIVFLDNTLTENGNPLFLENHQLEFATVACSSYGNGFWVFDQVQFRLVRFDQNLQETVNIPNLNQITGIRLQPVSMIEQENFLYMNDPETGILRFDIFGTYISTIPFTHILHFNVADQQLVYNVSPSELVFFGLKTLQEFRIELPASNYSDIAFSGQNLYMLRNDSLQMYRLVTEP